VCEIVQQAEQYRNKVVTVTGRYFNGPHGATIANQECGFQNRYDAFGSGAAIDLQNYDPSEGQLHATRDLVDEHSIQEFDKAVAEITSTSKSAQPVVALTVVGLLKVAERYTITKSRNGGYEGSGYGFMGRYPV